MNLNEEEEDKNPTEKENPEESPKKEKNVKKNTNMTYLDANLTTRKWRVKLYRLNEMGQWDDHGIGYVFCVNYLDENEKLINKLIMTNENTEEEMFSIELNQNTVDFHNQRGSIMTWNTGNDKDDDNTAISFQEKEGVTEIIKNILICEGKNPNDEKLFLEMQSDTYYEVSIQNLPNLVRELNIDIGEQKLINFINFLRNNDCEFILQLGEILKEEEKKIENLKTNLSSSVTNCNSNKIIEIEKDKNENNDINNINKKNEYNQQQIYKDLPMENIHLIFNIFKNLILIGDKDLLEILIEDEYYLITFGALEYDFETMKSVPHRKYFKNIVKFKNPLNIEDQNILKKINQNLRLTYLRDTALSRLIEDNAIKTINIMLQLNHNDIIQFFLNDTKYFEILFDQLKNGDLNIKKESCLFLSELIECSKDVIQSRITFNEYLFDQGILLIITKIIEENKNEEKNNEIKEFIKISAIEIFINILTIIPNAILDYLKKEKDHQLLKQFTNIMLYSENFGIKYEISQIYKTLIETQIKEQSMDRMELFSEPFQKILQYLNTPITSYPNPISHSKKMEISTTKQIIIEILITWFSLMSFNKQFWIEENKLNEIITNLLEESDKVINLYTIKLLKCIIDYADPFVCNRIITQKLCENLTKLFEKNIKKNNIIISSMMEFFDSLSKNKEIIFNNIMTFQSEFFYKNEKYFKIILFRYEHKSTPKRELINYLKNDYKDDASLFLNDFDYKDVGEIFGDEDKIIDYLSKKRDREEYNDELFDNYAYENENKKYHTNDYYNRIMFGNKEDNYDNNEDDLKKNGFLPILRINENPDDHDDNNDDEAIHF